MKSNACIILPIPLAPEALQYGGVEALVLHGKEIRFRVPPGGHYGSRLRLSGKAHLVDPSLNDGDLHLLVVSHQNQLYQVRRDVELDLRLNFDKLRKGRVERINLGNKSVDVTIPSIVAPGKRMRLRGLAEYCNGGYPGDIFLRLVEERRKGLRRFGFFDGFGAPSRRKIGIIFKLPFLFQISHEWIYDDSTAGLEMNK